MGNKKNFGEYYLGLDIGTDSVGWAVTDLKYNVLNFNRKAMWGIRLFEEGKTAATRRVFRSSRRRLARRKQRLNLLKKIFEPEINKVDPEFFKRMSQSFFHKEDKETESKYSLFFDKDYTDKEYLKKYPTIYHLRNAIIQGEKVDIRLVYLALHHILKNRGHFLFAGQDLKSVPLFEEIINELSTYLNDEYEIKLDCDDYNSFKELLKNRKILKKDKQKQLEELLHVNRDDKILSGVISAIIGRKTALKDLFKNNEELENSELSEAKFSFTDSNFDETYDKYKDFLEDRIELIDKLKKVYDWSILDYITQGSRFISERKVKIFDEHKQDLFILKAVIKKYFPGKDGRKNSKEYRELFSSFNTKNNYPAYIGMTKHNGKKVIIESRCIQDDFYKYVKKLLEKCSQDDPKVKNILVRIDNGEFLPKQVVKFNSVIPYQLHLEELNEILKNAQNYLPFLKVKDESGFSPSEKIKSLLTFRIPYYVGPLNTFHKREKGGYSWAVKRTNEPVRAWNFDKVIDLEKSAEKFILQMTSECTYLKKQDVLPKNSILYSKFMVLNELNNLTVNGEKIPLELKQRIFNELFCKKKKVTKANIKSLYLSKDDEIGGIDGDFKSSMSSYIDFKNIFIDKKVPEDVLDEIVKWIVILGDEKDMLKNKIKNEYGDIISEDEINKISKLKYSGWGRLSREFLTEIKSVNKETGEILNIINALYETDNNLMQLLSSEFDFMKVINEKNENKESFQNIKDYLCVKELYVSPAVKRGIWQTLQIVNEIVKITGREPKKIFIEMTRGNKPKSTDGRSRKNKLIDLYNNCKKEGRNWVEELNAKSESDLRSKRLYLYYTQMGKCMYSGENINLNDLFNKNIYDIDHIFPRSKVKDDSLDNMVLVKKELNGRKEDTYPIEPNIQVKMNSFWNYLKDRKLISEKKFDRLTRKQKFDDSELSGFIARQLVETSQATKAVAEILKESFCKSEIVYVKAGNVSDFRHECNYIKVREINDFHHAKDAYLNIVVGNIFNTRFTNNPLNFIKTEGSEFRSYSLKWETILKSDIKRGDVIAWESKGNSIAIVNKYMNKNNILFTRLAYRRKSIDNPRNKCGFWKQNPLKKGNGQFPIKMKDSRFRIELEDSGYKYGGYDSVVGSYFFLVESTETKGKKSSRKRTLEFVPVYLASNITNKKLEEYAINELKLKEPKIIIDCIKIDSLLDINGFKCHLSGRTNDNLVFKNANQLVLNSNYEKQIKNIINYYQRCNDNGKKELPVTKYDYITIEQNINIYNLLIDKFISTVYKKFIPVGINFILQQIDKSLELFKEQSLFMQCKIILDLLNILHCSSKTADLSLICSDKDEKNKRGKQCGALIKSKKINDNNVRLINQSVTGLFEQIVDLNK